MPYIPFLTHVSKESLNWPPVIITQQQQLQQNVCHAALADITQRAAYRQTKSQHSARGDYTQVKMLAQPAMSSANNNEQTCSTPLEQPAHIL